MTCPCNLPKSLAILAVAMLLPAVSYAQGDTIPERLAQGSMGRTRGSGSGHPPSITKLLNETDMVVRGIVGQPRVYLSDDQRDVYTDYPLEKPVVLYEARLASSAAPGTVPAVTVTQLGGTITINGLTFKHEEEGLSALVPGTAGLFLLRRIGTQYRIAGTYFGAFLISEGKLTPLASREAFAPEYRGVPEGPAVQQLVAQARSLRKKN